MEDQEREYHNGQRDAYIETLKDNIQTIFVKLDQISTDVTTLKTKASTWGGIWGGVSGIVAAMIIAAIKWMADR